MSTRTLQVRLQPHGHETKPVQLFFQSGDWAVTQGLCVFHANQCFRVTHLPSTNCIAVCIEDRATAEAIAREINLSFPKFKAHPRGDSLRLCRELTLEIYQKHGL